MYNHKNERFIYVITSEHDDRLPDTNNPIETSIKHLTKGDTTVLAVAIRYWNGNLDAAFEAIYQRKRIREKKE